MKSKLCKIATLTIMSMLSTNAFALSEKGYEQANTSKIVNGYQVLNCFASGDLSLKEDSKTPHTPFDFCKNENVDLILKVANSLDKPNFAGDLKLIKITPKANHKPKEFVDYALVVVVDEKDKLIMPSPYAYGVKSSSPTTNSETDKKVSLGALYATPKSFMFAFENPVWEQQNLAKFNDKKTDKAYENYSLFVSFDTKIDRPSPLQNSILGMFRGLDPHMGVMGIKDSNFISNVQGSYEYEIDTSEVPFSIVHKRYPEYDKELVNRENEFSVKYRTLDMVLKMYGR